MENDSVKKESEQPDSHESMDCEGYEHIKTILDRIMDPITKIHEAKGRMDN